MKPSRWYHWALLAIGALILIGVLFPSEEKKPTSQSTTTTPQAASRCRPAPRALVRQIESGMETRDGQKIKVRLENASTVRSKSFKRVWFVSAKLKGFGLDGDVATWVTNSLRTEARLLVASDAVAREWSVFGRDLPKSSPIRVSFTEDGGEESRACAGDS